MVHFTCKCQNVTLHLNASPQRSEDLAPSIRSATNIQNFGYGELSLAGIKTKVEKLLRGRVLASDPAWSCFRCLYCGFDVYLLNANRQLHVNLDIRQVPAELKPARSPAFDIIVEEDAEAANTLLVAPDEMDADILKLFYQIQTLLENSVSSQEKAMEERIKAYEREQRDLFTDYQLKAYRDRKILWHNVCQNVAQLEKDYPKNSGITYSKDGIPISALSPPSPAGVLSMGNSPHSTIPVLQVSSPQTSSPQTNQTGSNKIAGHSPSGLSGHKIGSFSSTASSSLTTQPSQSPSVQQNQLLSQLANINAATTSSTQDKKGIANTIVLPHTSASIGNPAETGGMNLSTSLEQENALDSRPPATLTTPTNASTKISTTPPAPTILTSIASPTTSTASNPTIITPEETPQPAQPSQWQVHKPTQDGSPRLLAKGTTRSDKRVTINVPSPQPKKQPSTVSPSTASPKTVSDLPPVVDIFSFQDDDSNPRLAPEQSQDEGKEDKEEHEDEEDTENDATQGSDPSQATQTQSSGAARHAMAISYIRNHSQSAPALLGTSLPVAIPQKMANWKSSVQLGRELMSVPNEDPEDHADLATSYDLPLSSTRRINRFL